MTNWRRLTDAESLVGKNVTLLIISGVNAFYHAGILCKRFDDAYWLSIANGSFHDLRMDEYEYYYILLDEIKF